MVKICAHRVWKHLILSSWRRYGTICHRCTYWASSGTETGPFLFHLRTNSPYQLQPKYKHSILSVRFRSSANFIHIHLACFTSWLKLSLYSLQVWTYRRSHVCPCSGIYTWNGFALLSLSPSKTFFAWTCVHLSWGTVPVLQIHWSMCLLSPAWPPLATWSSWNWWGCPS